MGDLSDFMEGKTLEIKDEVDGRTFYPKSKQHALHFLGNSIAYLLEAYMPRTSFDYPDISHRQAHNILEASEKAIRKELRDELNAARREQYHNESINAKN